MVEYVLIVHPSKGFLAASPDGIVEDTNIHETGLLEIKCPYSKRNSRIKEACADGGFFCTMNSSKLKLKRHHNYYRQVQLQLQHGVISLSIHRMTVNVNGSTKTLNGNNSLCLSWNDILMNGLHLNLLGHNTNPHTICNSIIFMTLSFHFGNHAHMLIMHASLSL